MPTGNFPSQDDLPSIESRIRKEKEVLYLRYKLQKGLLSRVYKPNGEEMEQMSEYLRKLERYPDLECSIMRSTKIPKVLKFILKLEDIPRDSEFQIRNRSKALLDTWKKSLEIEEGSTSMKFVQESLERINLLPSEVDDWVLVIHAGEDKVVMEEDGIIFVEGNATY